MEVGALVPEPSGGELDLSPQQIEELHALFRRFSKGKGKGGKPEAPTVPSKGGGGKGKGKGGK
eukprot:1844657-Alexandrium_andersonii.AAC.1